MKTKIILSVCFLGMILSFMTFFTNNIYAGEVQYQSRDVQMPDDIVDNFPEDEVCFPEDNEPDKELPRDLKSPKITKVQNVNKGIKLSWKKVKYADGYRVRRKTKGGSWKTLKSVKGTSYVDPEVKAKNGKIYFYRIVVYAENRSTLMESFGSDSESGKFMRLCVPASWKLKRNGTSGMTVSWKKNKKAGGVQIQYGTSKKFSKTKSVRAASFKRKKTLTALKRKKKYYIRLRYYKKIGKKTYYSPWSSEKSLKTGRSKG